MADTLKKAKFASLNSVPVSNSFPGSSTSNEPRKDVVPPPKIIKSEGGGATTHGTPAATKPVKSSDVPKPSTPVQVKSSTAAPAAAAPTVVSVTYRALDNTVQRLSVPLKSSSKTTLREVLTQLRQKSSSAAQEGWKVQLRYPEKAILTSDSELLDRYSLTHLNDYAFVSWDKL